MIETSIPGLGVREYPTSEEELRESLLPYEELIQTKEIEEDNQFHTSLLLNDTVRELKMLSLITRELAVKLFLTEQRLDEISKKLEERFDHEED